MNFLNGKVCWTFDFWNYYCFVAFKSKIYLFKLYENLSSLQIVFIKMLIYFYKKIWKKTENFDGAERLIDGESKIPIMESDFSIAVIFAILKTSS